MRYNDIRLRSWKHLWYKAYVRQALHFKGKVNLRRYALAIFLYYG